MPRKRSPICPQRIESSPVGTPGRIEIAPTVHTSLPGVSGWCSMKQIAELKVRMKAAAVPTIYINDNFGQWRSNLPQLVKKCLSKGRRGRAIVQRLQPDENDYIVLKPRHSGFFGTSCTKVTGTGLRPGRLSGMCSSGKCSRIRSHWSSRSRSMQKLICTDVPAVNYFEIGSSQGRAVKVEKEGKPKVGER